MQSTSWGTAFQVTDTRGGDHVLFSLYGSGEPTDDPGRSAFLTRTFAAGECIGLLTVEGRSAARTGEGRYRLLPGGLSAAGAELYSDDPDAP